MRLTELCSFVLVVASAIVFSLVNSLDNQLVTSATRTSSSCSEGERDVVDRAGGFDEDFSKEFTTVDCFCRVVAGVANNQEVDNASAGLNRTEEGFHNVLEGSTSELIIQFKQLCLSRFCDCIFQNQEQTTDVDSVECGLVSKCSLVTEEDDTLTRE